MALSGGWKQSIEAQALPTKWGTGIHPVHAIATEGTARSSQQAKLIAPNYGSNLGDIVPIEETDSYSYAGAEGEAAPWMGTGFNVENEDGWTPAEDLQEAIWGYGDDTGISNRPRMDADPSEFRSNTDLLRQGDWPSMDESGEVIRREAHGSRVTKRAKVRPTETVSEGWLNKVYGEVNEPSDADPSQLMMQTSHMQRDKTRAGSQTTGRADEHAAPIRSRIPGMRIKVYSGGERHYDMMPRQADTHIRPWWSRTMGTAPQEMLEPNAMEQRTPRTRNVPSDPDGGPEVPALDSHGYVAEDMIPYA